MAYSTRSDLALRCGGDERLVQLADWNRDADIDAVINEAIEDADVQINTYVAKQRLVPLSPVPDTVKRCSARIAIYNLKAARDMVDQGVQSRYDADLKWLDAVAKGDVTLGEDPQPPPASDRIDSSTTRPASKEVSRSRLRGFT